MLAASGANRGITNNALQSGGRNGKQVFVKSSIKILGQAMAIPHQPLHAPPDSQSHSVPSSQSDFITL